MIMLDFYKLQDQIAEAVQFEDVIIPTQFILTIFLRFNTYIENELNARQEFLRDDDMLEVKMIYDFVSQSSFTDQLEDLKDMPLQEVQGKVNSISNQHLLDIDSIIQQSGKEVSKTKKRMVELMAKSICRYINDPKLGQMH